MAGSRPTSSSLAQDPEQELANHNQSAAGPLSSLAPTERQHHLHRQSLNNGEQTTAASDSIGSTRLMNSGDVFLFAQRPTLAKRKDFLGGESRVISNAEPHLEQINKPTLSTGQQ